MTIHLSFPVVIPAAGIGSRMAASKAKQYLPIENKTILEHTLDIFVNQSNIGPIVVVLHPDDHMFASLPIASHPNIRIVTGGKERVNSVLAGLTYLQELGLTNQFVLVHDAARPCLAQDDLTDLISECLQATTDSNSLAGAILACPVSDTIKKSVNRKGGDTHLGSIIESTIDRSDLWQAQTPQMFKIDELTCAILNGLEKGYTLTDEASAIECDGKHVLLVEGPSSNIKITRPSDLPLASFYLKNRTNTRATRVNKKSTST